MTTKKVHPADAAELAGIENAVSFTVDLLKDGVHHKLEDIPTLDEARAKAAEIATGASRRPGVYAITADGRAHLVPASFNLAPPLAPADAPATKPKKAKAKKPAKPAKPKKAAAPKKTARKAATRPGVSKTDIAVKLLTRPQGATRKEVTTATEWPSINLKPIAKRRGMKLIEKEGVLRMVENA